MKIATILVVLEFASVLLAQGDSKPFTPTKGTLIALENAWNQAQLRHDAKVLDALVPVTFVYSDYDGTVMNKTQFLADAQDPAYQPTLMVNEGVEVYVYMNAAVVTGTYHAKGKYQGKPFDHWGRFTDTWLYQSDRWQCVASHTNLIKK